MARPKKAAAQARPKSKRAAAVSNLFEQTDRFILPIYYLPQLRVKTTNDAPPIAPVSTKGRYA